MERVSVEEAINIVLSSLKPITECEDVDVQDALYRVCAECINAAIDIPPFNRSAVDGYALCSKDSISASTENLIALEVAGKVFAGDVFSGTCREGQAIRIMTGAMIPIACDCVIRQEDVEVLPIDEGQKFERVLIKGKLQHNENIIFKGEDIKKGTPVLQSGTVLTSARLAMLSSLGMQTVRCLKAPRIAQISSGSELVKPGTPLPQGKIYNSNETMLGLRLKEIGLNAQILSVVIDDAKIAADQIDQIIGKIDVFISTGAVSVGEKDIFHEVFKILGIKKLFWGISMRPGGAMLCGIYKNKPLFCLSGPPFAAFANFELIVRPALDKIGGARSERRYITKAVLSTPIESRNFRRFLRAVYENGTVKPLGKNSGGGSLFLSTHCNCLLDLKPCSEYLAGGTVDVIML